MRTDVFLEMLMVCAIMCLIALITDALHSCLLIELGAGNIEVWHPSDVPIGGVHISGPVRLAKVAAQLGLSFAQAVVGFQHNEAGFAVPVFDGVVILERDRGTISAARHAVNTSHTSLHSCCQRFHFKKTCCNFNCLQIL